MLGFVLSRRAEPVLSNETVRLLLPRGSDHAAWAALRQRSRAFLEPWEPTWPPDELSAAAWRQRLKRYRRDMAVGASLPLLILDAGSGTLVGGITLANIRYGVAQSASIGYWMGEPYAGRGLMSAAMKLVISHAFDTLRLHRLEAACIPGNNRSIRVLEKAGFEREGLLKSYLKINGVWQDHFLYALISDRKPIAKD